MSTIIANILSTGNFLPIIVFFLLILAGINIPLSEDLIVISSAIIAQEYPPMLIPLYIAIYVGVVIGDHISYWIGYNLGHKIKKFKWFAKRLSDKKISIIQKYLNKYGIFTYIVCRFIPFGIRNTLFMSSGFSRMNYKLFTIYDLIAATINTSTLYFLVYFLGRSAEKPFKVAGIVLFILLFITLITIILKFVVFQKEKLDDSSVPVESINDNNGSIE